MFSAASEAAAERTAAVTAIYREAYAARYPELYVAPWAAKHRINEANLARILDGLGPRPRWLDLACGQAWQFSRFPGRARQVGIDLSTAQLACARRNAPEASFINADMAHFDVAESSLDLVTNFWAGYCYLASRERIASLVRRATGWLGKGGALYFEILLARDLESFNASRYSSRTGFAVAPQSEDYSEWSYEDIGGRHVMTSPPLEMFLELVEGKFEDVEAKHDGGFMVHLIARGRR